MSSDSMQAAYELRQAYAEALLEVTPEDADPAAPIMSLVSILASWIVSTASALDLDLEDGIDMAQKGIAEVAHSIAGPSKGEAVH